MYIYIEKTKRLISKYLYYFILIPVIAAVILDYNFKVFDSFSKEENSLSTLASMSGTLIGFLLTAISIFLTIPKDNNFMKNARLSGHHMIFTKIISFGIGFFTLTIVFWLVGSKVTSLAIYSFIAGVLEILAAFYYSYMFIKNF